MLVSHLTSFALAAATLSGCKIAAVGTRASMDGGCPPGATCSPLAPNGLIAFELSQCNISGPVRSPALGGELHLSVEDRVTRNALTLPFTAETEANAVSVLSVEHMYGTVALEGKAIGRDAVRLIDQDRRLLDEFVFNVIAPSAMKVFVLDTANRSWVAQSRITLLANQVITTGEIGVFDSSGRQLAAENLDPVVPLELRDPYSLRIDRCGARLLPRRTGDFVVMGQLGTRTFSTFVRVIDRVSNLFVAAWAYGRRLTGPIPTRTLLTLCFGASANGETVTTSSIQLSNANFVYESVDEPSCISARFQTAGLYTITATVGDVSELISMDVQ